MYPPIQALQETLSRKDLPPVCEYDLEAESPLPREHAPRGGEDCPPAAELLAGIELGKILREANEA